MNNQENDEKKSQRNFYFFAIKIRRRERERERRKGKKAGVTQFDLRKENDKKRKQIAEVCFIAPRQMA